MEAVVHHLGAGTLGLHLKIEDRNHVHGNGLGQLSCLAQALEEGTDRLTGAALADLHHLLDDGAGDLPWRSGAPCAGRTHPSSGTGGESTHQGISIISGLGVQISLGHYS